MKIFVGTKTGKSVILDVEASDTIENICFKIMDKKKDIEIQNIEDIELYSDGKLLVGNRTLADYDIEEDDTLLLVICPKKIKIKKIKTQEMLINEKKETQSFLKQFDLNEVNNKFKVLTGQNFDIHDLEIAQPNNKEKYEERKQEIQEIGNKLLKETIKNNEDYINNVTKFGQKMRDNIIYETFNNPEKFIKPSEIQNAKEGSVELIEGALAELLSDNNITCAIEKEASDVESSRISLQLITSGEAFRKNLKISFSDNDEKDALIITNEEEKQKFIKEKKILYSQLLNIPEENIIISHIEYGSVNYWLQFIGKEITQDDVSKIEKDAKDKGQEIDIKLGCLVCGCKINSSMFDQRGNRNSGWGINEKRGPPGHLMDYDPPQKWFGYGLKVWDVYGDNKWLGYTNEEGEWYIAYHGTSGSFGQSILDQGFKAGDGQACRNHTNINELSKNEYPVLGEGVYCTPKISIADGYSKTINFGGKNYKFVFMCRVNPKYVRMSSNDYWVVSGDKLGEKNSKKYDDQIRPYRILLK